MTDAVEAGILGGVSRENVELVMRALTATIRRPKPDFDTINALFHPDHVLVGDIQRDLGETPIEGAAGYREWLDESPNVMSWEWDVESAIDVGREIVLAVGTMTFAGATSEVRQQRRMWLVVTLADRKIARTEIFFDPAKALEAAGLSE